MTSHAEATKVYWDNFESIVSELINSDGVVNARLAETNATGWGAEPSDEPTVSNLSGSSFDFEAEISLSGDSDPERGWCGDAMTVELSGTFKKVDGKWELDHYEVVSATTNFDTEVDTDD